GVCPGPTHPAGLRMCAPLTASVFEFTRPTYSSIVFGRFPAATMRVGFAMWVGMGRPPSGVQARHVGRGGEHGGLVERELVETRPHFGGGRERGGELDVRLVMARFAGEEPAG